MQTTVKDFYIVKILEDATDRPMGTVLYGVVIEDKTGRFTIGSHVCTSLIETIKPELKKVITKSGREYMLAGSMGKTSTAYLSEIPLLRDGHSPEFIKSTRKVP